MKCRKLTSEVTYHGVPTEIRKLTPGAIKDAIWEGNKIFGHENWEFDLTISFEDGKLTEYKFFVGLFKFVYHPESQKWNVTYRGVNNSDPHKNLNEAIAQAINFYLTWQKKNAAQNLTEMEIAERHLRNSGNTYKPYVPHYEE